MKLKKYTQDVYKQELRKLRQRVNYRKRLGYDIDIDKLLENTGQSLQYDTEYIKSLRGAKLLGEAKPMNNNVSDFERMMNPPDFTPPPDRVDPFAYSHIEQIQSLLLEFPNTIVLQFDEGTLAPKYGDRDTVSVEFMGNALYEIFDRTVNKAIREGREQELEAYYESVQPRLGEILEPYFTNIPYFFESELIKNFTEMLTLLNWGEALSQSEMEELSEIYDFTDIELNEYGDEYY